MQGEVDVGLAKGCCWGPKGALRAGASAKCLEAEGTRTQLVSSGAECPAGTVGGLPAPVLCQLLILSHARTCLNRFHELTVIA